MTAYLSEKTKRTIASDFFDVADGIEDPTYLVACDDVEDGRFYLDKDFKSIVERRIQEGDGGKGLDTRGLYGVRYGCESYEMALNLCDGGFNRIIEVYRGIVCKTVLSLLDFGCGEGIALSEILENAVINANGSVGITLDSPGEFTAPRAKNRIVVVNALNIAPKADAVDRARFDVLVSVCGAIPYHPLNKSWGRMSRRNCASDNSRMFGILQAINLLKDRGLLLANTENVIGVGPENAAGISTLIRMGILKVIPNFSRFAPRNEYRDADAMPLATVLNRRPSLAEIKKLLGIGEDNLYRIQSSSHVECHRQSAQQ